MVFFTCNKCGDALKKKDVAKHVGRCRDPLSLTCVDCHKDFYGDEYIAHTSCVTEAEKYGVKGFQSRAPSTAGVSKQEDWMQAIHSATEAPGLTSQQRSFLTALTRHDNVPRKLKQFHNFARNVWRESFRPTDVVGQVFSMIELKLKEIKGPQKENGTTKDNCSKENGDGLEKNPGDVVIKGITNKKFEKKKHKLQEEKSVVESKVNGEGGEEEPVSVKIEENTSKKSKKKKHKKQEEEAGVGERTVDMLTEENTSKKSNKRKLKSQANEAVEESKQNGDGTEENTAEVTMEVTTCSKKSKKKHKKQEKESVEEKMNGNNIETVTVDAVVEDSANKKSKKNKHKRQEEETVDETKENGNKREEKTAETVEDKTGKKMKKKKHRQVEEEEVPRKKAKKSKQME